MALHRNSSESNKHTPKGFDSAGNMFKPLRDENGESRYTPETHLPSAINFIDGSAIPPTEVAGDIYVLVDIGGGAVHVNWDGANYNDWVRFNPALLIWINKTPDDGVICYNGDSQLYQKYNSPDWEDFGAGGGSAVNLGNTNLTQTVSTNRLYNVNSNNLQFTNFQLLELGDYTAGIGAYLQLQESVISRMMMGDSEVSLSASGSVNLKNTLSKVTLDGAYNLQLDSDYATSSNGGKLELNGASNKFTDHNTTKVGLEYSADYSADFTNRSLVDKEYVDDKISKNIGATYTTNNLTTVTQAEYDAIGTPDANTIYFIV